MDWVRISEAKNYLDNVSAVLVRTTADNVSLLVEDPSLRGGLLPIQEISNTYLLDRKFGSLKSIAFRRSELFKDRVTALNMKALLHQI